jgi:integrase
LNALAAGRAGPGLHGDGKGLWLFVTKRSDGSLSKRWAFRWRKHGVYGERSIGAYPDLALADARKLAGELRADLARGVDLAAQRQEERAAALAKAAAPKPLTFTETFEQYITMVGTKKWRPGGRHERQFRRSFTLHVLPILGKLPIAAIKDQHAHAVLDPLYDRLPRTAARIRARCAAVFAWAKHRKLCSGDSPWAWSGNLEHVYPPKPSDQHYRNIQWQEVPALFARLSALETSDALAARLQLGLALRPGEVRHLKWRDIGEDEISIPITKTGEGFRQPLNDAARAALASARACRMSDWVFPGRNPRKPIGERAVYNIIQALTEGAGAAHAVARSCFSDWAYETTSFSDSVIEAALHHRIPGGGTVSAYKRGDQIDRRRALLAAWSDFLTGRGNVVALRPLAATA